MKYAIVNLGCKVNAFEAEAVSEMLSNNGHTRVSFDEQPDATIVFTCAVTNTAAAKSRKILHQAKRIKEDEITALVGCYVQVNDGLLEEADILVGSANKKKLPQYIEQYLKDHKKIRDIASLENVPFDSFTSSVHDSKARCDLKIQDGCNQFCSYCVIPYARGHERSAKMDNVLKEAQILAKKSKEIVLTGIHTGRYFDGTNHLIDLLRELIKIDELKTIRLSSIEITEITDEIIELMSKNSKIAHHLHIPLQSGSDKILELMNRPYDKEYFLSRVSYIREMIPDISISTDLITGFPNETDAEFEETIEFLKKIRFSFIHLFPYSRKDNTKAYDMPMQVSEPVKKERVKIITDIQKEITAEFKSRYMNKILYVLAENSNNSYTFGHSKEYLDVMIDGVYKHNEIYKVFIYETGDVLKGKVID